jgi:hypothetical protein
MAQFLRRSRSVLFSKSRPKPLQAPLGARTLPRHRDADSSSAPPSPPSSLSPSSSTRLSSVPQVDSLSPPQTPSSNPHLSSRTQSVQSSQSRIFSRTISLVAMSSSLNNDADPVERTTSPYSDPRQIGPKSKILATRTSNYHSTSLRNMVTVNTVNKTALHPGGVQYAHPPGVDRVAVCRNHGC